MADLETDKRLAAAQAEELAQLAKSPVSLPPVSASDEVGTGPDIVVNARVPDADYRVRLKPFPGKAREDVLGPRSPDNILNPLWATNGLLFPYTPSIQFSQDVDWKNVDLTHTNYDTAAYSRTPSVQLSVSGKFTVETHEDGKYLLSVLHFLRVVSKMNFGKEDAQTNKAGLPPPVLLFSGYGPYMFNDVRVVVRNHSYTFDDTVNMVEVVTGPGESIRLPVILQLSMTLQVVQTPRDQKDGFVLNDFRTGTLMKRGGWL